MLWINCVNSSPKDTMSQNQVLFAAFVALLLNKTTLSLLFLTQKSVRLTKEFAQKC